MKNKNTIKLIIKNGIASLISILLGALTTKIIATVAGPAGIGIYSQLRQLQQWFTTLATVNGNSSLVRGVATRDGAERLEFITIVGIIYLTGTAFIALLLVLFAPSLSKFIFAQNNSDELTLAVYAVAAVVCIGSAASFLTGVINGYREIGALANIQIFGSLGLSFSAYPLALWGNPISYVMIVAFGMLSTFLYSLYVVIKRRLIVWINWQTIFHFNYFLRIGKEHIYYSITMLATGIIGASSVLIIRFFYIQKGGLELAGIFDAAWNLSMMYVMIFLSSLGTSYLPMLMANQNNDSWRDHVMYFFRISTIFGCLCIPLIIIIKPFLINLLFSQKFEISLEIFRWMLIGDYFKIHAWVFGMLLIAFNRKKDFLISECIYQIVLLIPVILFLKFNYEIVGQSFAIANIFYCAYVWLNAQINYGIKISGKPLKSWYFGLVLVLVFSLINWNSKTVSIYQLLLWTFMGLLTIIITTTSAEKKSLVSLVNHI